MVVTAGVRVRQDDKMRRRGRADRRREEEEEGGYGSRGSQAQLGVHSFCPFADRNITAASSLTEGRLSAGCSLEERGEKTKKRGAVGVRRLKVHYAELKRLHSARLISLR